MNRAELIVATTIVLLVAFALGCFAHWLVHRFTRVGEGEMGEVDRLAQQLHEAEETRDEAIAWFQDREQVLQSQLNQSEAEMRAAMDALRESRAEAEQLRGYIEKMNAG